ncbi:outer membrane protein assembly factor BamB family protein [Aneurinibacillus sp. REN35]|uniref:outer membrane protein assembly factor BamB family protein n=1 Tax=Aneurinibacillus sp. REN35 TaxID=3237286 RepID=UPI0035286750
MHKKVASSLIGMMSLYGWMNADPVFAENPSPPYSSYAHDQAARSFGPPAWQQYRMNPTNNAVFANQNEDAIKQKYLTNNEVRGNPVIVEDTLYIGNHGTGDVFSFAIKNGQRNWKSSVPNWIHGDTIYAEGRLYIGYGNRNFTDLQEQKIRGTKESGVVSLDAKTGKTIWQYKTKGEVMPTPVYDKGSVYIATGDNKLYSLDAATGSMQWSLDLPGWVSMSSPVLKDGMLYVGSLDTLVAVDVEERKIKWAKEQLGTVTDVPPAISENNVVVITGTKKVNDPLNPSFLLTEEERKQYGTAAANYHFIYAFDASTGTLLWKDLLGTGPNQSRPFPLTNTSGAPAIAGDYAFVGSPYTKSFFAYHLPSGKKVWEYKTEAGIKGAPAIKDGLVYAGDTKGTLYILRAKDGSLVNKHKIGGALSPGGPVIMNNTLFIGSQDGYVYAKPIAELLP